MTGAETDMRELSEQEIGAIAGGYSPSRAVGPPNGYQPWKPPNPLTVTFGTPVAPGLGLPGEPLGWLG